MNDSEVTLSTIGRMAGVGRACVANWRRTHADFPEPVGGTATSPTFQYAAAEDWLRAYDKPPYKEFGGYIVAGGSESIPWATVSINIAGQTPYTVTDANVWATAVGRVASYS